MKNIGQEVGIVVISMLIGFSPAAHTAPRQPLPPWPERALARWGFDNDLLRVPIGNAALGLAGSSRVESWSGYALRREAGTVTPVAIPALAGAGAHPHLALDTGTVRF